LKSELEGGESTSTLSTTCSTPQQTDSSQLATSQFNNQTEENEKIIAFIQNLSPLHLYQLRHRELFYSKYYETDIPVTSFRGRLKLNLFLADVNSFEEYLASAVNNSDNKFFYQMTYDPGKNMISDDKVLIRVGSKFQADVPELLTNGKRRLERNNPEPETLEWSGLQCSSVMGEISVKKYLNKVIETKLKSNEIYKGCEINETRDKIMVILKH
jgi:hypothetical protein